MTSARLPRLLALIVLMLAIPAASFAGVFVSISVAPPPLPVYVQPVCPQPGYMWTPGYWAWGDEGYYWVPGTWVPAPQPGLLWTPGYWGFEGGAYLWHAGYWGPHIGFYGGVNYGFGYGGVGFVGGEWRGGAFFYNSAVVNVNRTVVNNVYVNKTVIVNNTTVNRVSFNGGAGGIQARPTPEQQRFMQERHFAPTSMQADHEHGAARNPQLLAKNNGGRPGIAATGRAGDFAHPVAARAAGGRVAPESLHANPRSMPAQQAASANHPAPGRPTPNNVPRPPASSPSRPTAQGQPSRYSPPPAQHNAPQAPQNRSNAPAPHNYNAPQSRNNAPAPQQHNNAPAQHNNAPQQHSSAPREENERGRR